MSGRALTLALTLTLAGAGCIDLNALRATDGGGGDASGALDGGGGDLAPSSACGAGGPATGCAGRGYLVCDGFEDSTTGNFPHWDGERVDAIGGGPTNPGTKLEVAQMPACHGANVLHGALDGANQDANLNVAIKFPNPVYVRFQLYVPSTDNADQLTVFGIADVNASDVSGLILLPMNGRLVYFHGGSHFLQSGVPRDKWTCVELAITQDHAAGSIALYLDGKKTDQLDNLDTASKGAGWTTFQLGTATAASAASVVHDIYYDEVAVAAAPIGCD